MLETAFFVVFTVAVYLFKDELANFFERPAFLWFGNRWIFVGLLVANLGVVGWALMSAQPEVSISMVAEQFVGSSGTAEGEPQPHVVEYENSFDRLDTFEVQTRSDGSFADTRSMCTNACEKANANLSSISMNAMTQEVKCTCQEAH